VRRTEIIRNLIDNSGMSVKAFAAKVGLPYSTLRSILERGIGNASVDNVIKVCRGLGITVEQLDEIVSEDDTKESMEDDILTKAAHKVGHVGSLSDEEKNAVELAIKIALAKHNK
jgi:predicted transcriptional regulator